MAIVGTAMQVRPLGEEAASAATAAGAAADRILALEDEAKNQACACSYIPISALEKLK